MSITLLTSKPRMFSTVLDVVTQATLVKTEHLDFNINSNDDSYDPYISRDREIENYIVRADSIINTYLKSIYGAPSGLRIDAWSTPPVHGINNESEETELLGLEVLLTSGYTQYYSITFSSATAFSVRGSLEGSQGSGNTSADFTTTNAILKIGTNSWDLGSVTGFTSGDVFYFSIIDCYPIINSISSMLAAAMLLTEKFGNAVPNESDLPKKLEKRAMDLLIKLADPDDPLSLLEEVESSLETTSVDYNVSALGEDNSSYLTENELDL